MLICSYQSVSIVLYMCVMLVLLYDKTEEDRRQKTEDRRQGIYFQCNSQHGIRYQHYRDKAVCLISLRPTSYVPEARI